jgi:3-deoxy-D-manno-octulosonic-acid transferase
MSEKPGLLRTFSLGAIKARGERRRIAAEIARGGPEAARLAEKLGQPGQRRPDGALIWLHLADPRYGGAVRSLAEALAEAHPEAALLFTQAEGTAPQEADLPPVAIRQFAPLESDGPVAAFLDHWRPDLCFWAGEAFRPKLIEAAARRGASLVLIGAETPPPRERAWRRLFGSGPGIYGVFEHLFVTDEEVARALVAAGLPRGAVETDGGYEEEAPPLPYNRRDRDALAAALKARPIWLAAAVPVSEEAAFIAAHRAARRLAHRLLLILAPADPARGAALAAELEAQGFLVAARSGAGEPDAGTDIFLADSEGEMGLWYRLAPISYMGGTLDPKAGGGRSPFEPAALGSAILHGPARGARAKLYARFAMAGAAREVGEGAALGPALADLLAPDKAAAMAHAAWRVSTGWADTRARLLALAGEALLQRAAG